MLTIANATILQGDTPFIGNITLSGDTIAALGPDAAASGDTLDATGLYAAPGFIDLHTHGMGGHDFMDADPEQYAAIARAHLRHGATGILPTTTGFAPGALEDVCTAYRKACTINRDGAQLLGLHLEGPYMAPAQCGALDPALMRTPDPAEYLPLLARHGDIIRRWSMAPELPGVPELAAQLRARGILLAIAHTDADCDAIERAGALGFTHFTHLYSGMSGVRRRRAKRYAGAVEAALLMDDATVEIICDGMHLPTELIRLVYTVKGPARTALTTDSMRAAGLPDGTYALGSASSGQQVIVREGVAWMPDFESFAGSVATCDRLLRVAVQQARIPLCHAVRMLSATPARILGLRNKGALAPGMDADIVLLDEQLHVRHVLLAGRIV